MNYILSANLRKYRKNLDLTQEQFAELLDLSWKTIVNIESGKHFPKAKNIDKICKKLNIDCFELFIDESKEISKKAKLAKINSLLENFDENKLDSVYKIINAIN